MVEFTTQSGATVVINVAPFEDALELNNAIGQYLMGAGLSMDTEMNISVESLAKVMIGVATKREIQAHVMKCLSRCTYNKQKIETSTFEDATARADYYEVAMACVKENISPFVNGLFSQFSVLLGAYQQLKTVNIQK